MGPLVHLATAPELFGIQPVGHGRFVDPVFAKPQTKSAALGENGEDQSGVYGGMTYIPDCSAVKNDCDRSVVIVGSATDRP